MKTKAMLLLAAALAACTTTDGRGEGTTATTDSATTVTTDAPTMTVATTTAPAMAPSTTTTVAVVTVPDNDDAVRVSQSAEHARRDGVIPEIAELPYFRRVDPQLEVVGDEGMWVLATLSQVVQERSWADGCGFGDLDGVYPTGVICTAGYGEVLLVVDGSIVNAYPMPGAVPSWLHVADKYVYGGRIGDGGLPDSTLVRIDRETLEATVVVIPAPFDGGTDWLPDWHIAPAGYFDRYYEAVHINSGKSGTPVASWIGEFDADLDGIDAMIAEVAGS